MTTEPSAEEPLVVESMEDVDYWLKRLSELNEIATREDTLYKAMLARLKQRHEESAKPITDEQAQIRDAIATFMQRRRPSLIKRLGKTIPREHGQLKWYIRGRSLETPKDEKPIIDWLHKVRGGKRYLIVTESIDRHALAAADPKLIRRLWPLGVWVGRHEYFSIQAEGEEHPTVVRKRRYPFRG